MADFVISDTHFFDSSIIRHTKRGFINPQTGKFNLFKDEFEMNRHIIESWNSVVSKKDTVFHLGDFCSKCTYTQARVIFNNLNGNIILIAGNHDIETEGVMDILRKLPFKSIVEYPIVYDRYIFSHKPLRQSGTFINVHGHSHGKSGKGIDVCAELLGFRPLSILELMGEHEEKVANHVSEGKQTNVKNTPPKVQGTKNNKSSRWNRDFLKRKKEHRKNIINNNSD